MSKAGSGKEKKQQKIPWQTVQQRGSRGGKKGISPAEAAARARQSERDKAKSQAGAFQSTTTTLVSKLATARFAIPWDEYHGVLPGGVCLPFKDSFDIEAAGIDDWLTAVIEVKRLEAYVTFEDEPFGLIHTSFVTPRSFDWSKSSKSIGELSPRCVKSKGMSKRTPVLWEKGEYKLDDFCPALLIEDLSDGSHMIGKNVIVELVCQWRIKGM